MKQTKNIAFSAMLAAIAFVILLLGSVIESVTLSMTAVASLCIMLAVAELGYGYAFLTYAVASTVSFLILPSKQVALLFAAFIGYYPILKSLFEKLPRLFAYIFKGVAFIFGYSLIAVCGYFLFVPQENYIKIALILSPFALAAFYLADFAMTRLITLYCTKLRKRLGIDALLK